MERIKSFFKEQNFRVLVGNFLSLAVLQVLNILLPFLTIPYLLRVVGVEKFGLISFALAFVTFFQIAVEYGFNTISTRDVSIASKDSKAVQQIFNQVLTTKLFLLGISTFVFVGVVVLIPKFKADLFVYLFTYIMVIGQALFPVWLFQGLQQMKYITYLNVIFKTVCTLLIFLVVKQESDYFYAPLLTSLGFLFSGLASLWVAKSRFNIRFSLCTFKQVKEQLSKAKYLFLSEFQIALIANANVLIVGFLLNDTAVGYYATAEKVIRAISNLQAPLINAFYPYVSKLMLENKNKAIQQIKKLARYGSIVDLVALLLLFVLSPLIFSLLFGTETEESVLVFRIMIVFPLLSFLDQLFGKLILLTNNKESLFFKVFFYTSIASVVLCVGLTHKFGFIGTAIASTIAQSLLAFGMWFYAKPFLRTS
ncbi:flippase [Myroides sp. NP-2]|uniref:flippase n=1 Tax=Myroides sp. NP-2 TaxID=2759945 RepID=UPI0015F96DBF|nr:flippase [Myroides sp. NP-2]MBB1150983.1 flippase [Myroides sp. NP-2]